MSPEFQAVQAYISLIKDIITGLAALTAAIVAVIGLRAWRNQLKGKTEYALAQRLLRAVYKVREALVTVRNPFQSAAEISQAMAEAKIEGNPLLDPQVHARSEAAVYQYRWRGVQEAFIDLESISLEAEALWGQKIKDNLMALQQCAATLATNIQSHLRQLERSPREYDADAEKKRDSIIYGWPKDASDNPFSGEINRAVSQMESSLKPHLKL